MQYREVYVRWVNFLHIDSNGLVYIYLNLKGGFPNETFY